MKLDPGELHKWQFWLLNCLAGSSLVLFIFIIFLATGNQAIQSEINSRQRYINQTVKVSRLNSQLIQTLANLSAQTGDGDIQSLLSAQGISFKMQDPDALARVAEKDAAGVRAKTVKQEQNTSRKKKQQGKK